MREPNRRREEYRPDPDFDKIEDVDRAIEKLEAAAIGEHPKSPVYWSLHCGRAMQLEWLRRRRATLRGGKGMEHG